MSEDQKQIQSWLLTVVRHALVETLVEAAVLALIAVLLMDPASELTLLVLQLQADGSPEETLEQEEEEQGYLLPGGHC